MLSDRWEDIYITTHDKYFCQENCEFISYNITTQKVKCNCVIEEESLNINLADINFTYIEIMTGLSKTLNNSNFRVLECYKLIFDFKSFIKNIGSIIMAIIMIIFFILMIIYFITGQKKIKKFIKNILKLKNEEKNYHEKRKKENINIVKTKKIPLKKEKKNHPIKKFNINKSKIKIKINNSYSIYQSSRKLDKNSDNNLLDKKKISKNKSIINSNKNTIEILKKNNKQKKNRKENIIIR